MKLTAFAQLMLACFSARADAKTITCQVDGAAYEVSR